MLSGKAVSSLSSFSSKQQQAGEEARSRRRYQTSFLASSPSTTTEPQSYQQQLQPKKGDSNTSLAFWSFVLMLGASGSFVMYTKKAGDMLRSMEQVSTQHKRMNPPAIGPMTKAEWEKMRPRWGKEDDLI